MIAHCTDCGREFEAKGARMKCCWKCWRQPEDRKLENRAYDQGYDDGRRDGIKLAQRAYEDGVREGARRQTQGGSTNGRMELDTDLLRDLVQLCHPDRHPPERAIVANRATATLIELLNRERKTA